MSDLRVAGIRMHDYVMYDIVAEIRENLPHFVEVRLDVFDEAKAWSTDQFGENSYRHGCPRPTRKRWSCFYRFKGLYSFNFLDANDALLFEMRWK